MADWVPMTFVAAIFASLLIIEGMQWSLRRRLRRMCAAEGRHHWDLDEFGSLVCLRCERRLP